MARIMLDGRSAGAQCGPEKRYQGHDREQRGESQLVGVTAESRFDTGLPFHAGSLAKNARPQS